MGGEPLRHVGGVLLHVRDERVRLGRLLLQRRQVLALELVRARELLEQHRDLVVVPLEPVHLAAERGLRREGAALGGLGAGAERLTLARALRERALRVHRLAPHRVELALQLRLLGSARVAQHGGVRLGCVALQARFVGYPRLGMELVRVERFQRRERACESLRRSSHVWREGG